MCCGGSSRLNSRRPNAREHGGAGRRAHQYVCGGERGSACAALRRTSDKKERARCCARSFGAPRGRGGGRGRRVPKKRPNDAIAAGRGRGRAATAWGLGGPAPKKALGLPLPPESSCSFPASSCPPIPLPMQALVTRCRRPPSPPRPPINGCPLGLPLAWPGRNRPTTTQGPSPGREGRRRGGGNSWRKLQARPPAVRTGPHAPYPSLPFPTPSACSLPILPPPLINPLPCRHLPCALAPPPLLPPPPAARPPTNACRRLAWP